MTTTTTPTTTPSPQVGVGVLVIRNGLVLLGLRAGSHGAGTWALPGGHLEFGESVEDCARREVLEETGLVLQTITPAPYTNDVMLAQGKHYLTAFVEATAAQGEPQRPEPTKCLEWRWCRWTAMPTPLFQPLQTLLGQGFIPHGAT